ncbi:hypothetical protein JS756_30645 [Streptomyces actuosus]|uniref:YD repeat-containing protein n=1 Tax=Streptomyces actuosus TaxID=1885 RepID=A0ABS2VZ10_STRAS|nr:hypothetical protein [Streptomyces actuosus]
MCSPRPVSTVVPAAACTTRLVTGTDPAGRKIGFEFDENGRLAAKTAGKTRTTFSYDAASRPTAAESRQKGLGPWTAPPSRSVTPRRAGGSRVPRPPARGPTWTGTRSATAPPSPSTAGTPWPSATTSSAARPNAPWARTFVSPLTGTRRAGSCSRA